MDYIIRMIAKNAPVSAMAITATNMVSRAQDIHKTWPLGTAALGRVLMATSLIGNMMKVGDSSVTVRVMGNGPLKGVLAVSDSEGNVRGYVHEGQVEVPNKAPAKLDVGAGIGEGTLTVIKDFGLKEPYVGTIPLITGEIAEDITAYFVESEQIPTACALGVLIDSDHSVLVAGGYLIQLLPGADEKVIDSIEAGIAELGAVTPALQKGMTPEEVLRTVLKDFELDLLETQPVDYRCYCTRDRMRTALVSLGKVELQKMIEEEGKAELTCQFCDSVQLFDKNELEEIMHAL